jgi:hypothetical protein
MPRRRSIALWLSLSMHLGIGAIAVVLSSGLTNGATPRTIQLSGKSAERVPGRDVLFEVLNGDGMPIHLKSATGDASIGLAWWSPAVGLWLAVDRLPAAPERRRLEVALQVGSQNSKPIGTIDVDEHGSGRIVVIWPTDRPAPETPVSLTVSVPGSFWPFARSLPALAGAAPMRK